MNCASCDTRNCTKGQNCLRLPINEVADQYTEECQQIMEAAAKIEGRYYLQLTRIEESVKLAQELSCHSIGVAFCMGLAQEAKYIVQYLEKFFTVHSACCKICGISKTEFNLEQIKAGKFEAICNPAVQAKVLNEAKTDLNFIVGLCVGHDMIFTRCSAAPVSTLVAKDRVLCHNPLGAIYSGYWRNNKLGLKD
ncbi:MAG: hypothetical protein H6Q68_646 [Firmicutes bacterium]|nr:hypothetical protein [Bacillota bacterium]